MNQPPPPPVHLKLDSQSGGHFIKQNTSENLHSIIPRIPNERESQVSKEKNNFSIFLLYYTQGFILL